MIERRPVPASSLLARHAGADGYADCYCTEIDGSVSHAEFVEAFYTTPLFKVERLILRLAVSRPYTDAEARRLARGERDQFAAWSVKARDANQLLLADFSGRTCSWLMTEAVDSGGVARTRLYFGSAVLPRRDRASGRSSLGFAFSALLGFHKLYSRALLASACSRLSRIH